MSSFYGQMRWQDFKRFFYNFTLSNNQFATNNQFNETPNDGEPTITGNLVAYLQPNEDFATFKINTANHWIKVCPTDSIGDAPVTYSGFSLFHDKPNAASVEQIKIFDVSAIPADEEITVLKEGECLKFLDLKIDKAGHSVTEDLKATYFQLPQQIIRVNFSKDLYVNDDQKFHFQEDDWVKLGVSEDGKVLNFSHTTVFNEDQSTSGFEKPEGEDEYQVVAKLKEGDYFSTDRMVYDKAGHLVSTTRVYYQLPISEVIGDIADLSTIVTELKENVEKAQGVIKDHTDLINDHEERLTDAQTMLGDNSEMQTALGKLEAAAAGQQFTVSQGFVIMTDHLQTSVDESLKGVYARLAAIEKKVGINYG